MFTSETKAYKQVVLSSKWLPEQEWGGREWNESWSLLKLHSVPSYETFGVPLLEGIP